MPLDPAFVPAPVCAVRDHVHTVHDDPRPDPYFWLREKGTPEVTAYLDAENAYTDAVFLNPTAELRETLYGEVLARLQETDLSVPYPDNGYRYYSRTEEGKSYPIYCRVRAMPNDNSAPPINKSAAPIDNFATTNVNLAAPTTVSATQLTNLAAPFTRLASENDGSASGNSNLASQNNNSASGNSNSASGNGESATDIGDSATQIGEEITLDVNALAESEAFLSVGLYEVSDDARYLAYSTDTTGFRDYTLRIKDLQTGELLPDAIEKVDGAEWSADGKYLFYVTEDEQKRPYRVYRHTVGDADTTNDVPIYEENDAVYRAFLTRSRDKKYVFVGSASSTSTEYHYLDAANPTGDLTCVLPREAEHEYYLDHRHGTFYLRTNKDALNFRLVSAPVNAPNDWTQIVAHRDSVMLEDVTVFADYLVLEERENGLPRLVVRDFATSTLSPVTFPEPTYALIGDENHEWNTPRFRFRYSSLVSPTRVYDLDLATGNLELLKETPVLGGFDRTQYVSDYRFATASDGTQIPVSLVRHVDTPIDGSAPALLYGYGSYGIVIPAAFNSSIVSLLDRGFVFAVGHIRGGGELGKPWHNAGKMAHKANTFTDFIAVADFLVSEGYTTHPKLAIRGGSAGGLLMGAVVNLRPDVAGAVVSLVPFVDVLTTMLDDTLPLTVGEYIEWGNPQIKAEYDVMRTYCPYTNLAAKAYPPMLCRTSLNDSQVMYWEPAKYVAKLRTLKTAAVSASTTRDAPLLFHCNMAAGHGGSSGRYDALKETAMDYAFVLATLGVGDTVQ